MKYKTKKIIKVSHSSVSHPEYLKALKDKVISFTSGQLDSDKVETFYEGDRFKDIPTENILELNTKGITIFKRITEEIILVEKTA